MSYFVTNALPLFAFQMIAASLFEINHMAWLVKNNKTLFCKLTQKIYWLVSGKQTSKQVHLRLLDSFQPFGLLFHEVLVLFLFGKIEKNWYGTKL